MAKNTAKVDAAQDASGAESGIIIEDGVIHEAVKKADEIMAQDAASVKGQSVPESSGCGVMLHPDNGSTPAGQIAAQSAMRTAYQCVYGKSLLKKDLTAWSEGGIILPATQRDAEILVRICYALGVLAEVVGPSE